MKKGLVMDDEGLKNPNYIFGEDYFEEILERIRNHQSELTGMWRVMKKHT